jgi:hypothetical protein
MKTNLIAVAVAVVAVVAVAVLGLFAGYAWGNKPNSGTSSLHHQRSPRLRTERARPVTMPPTAGSP